MFSFIKNKQEKILYARSPFHELTLPPVAGAKPGFVWPSYRDISEKTHNRTEIIQEKHFDMTYGTIVVRVRTGYKN